MVHRLRPGRRGLTASLPTASSSVVPSRPGGEARRPRPILETRHLTVRFGGLTAVHDVPIVVPEGRLVALIGPNGAGKTTLVDALTGFVPSTGEIEFAGRRIERWPAHRRARAGIIRTFQSVELFEDLSVAENLSSNADPFQTADWLVDLVRRPRADRVELEPLQLLGLEHEAASMPAELSHGTRRLVGLARALASKPRVLLLDEPAAGLDAGETGTLAVKLRQIVDEKMSNILLVEHDMDLVMSVCDEIYVLNFGELIAHGSPEEVQRDRMVRQAYLGDSIEERP